MADNRTVSKDSTDSLKDVLEQTEEGRADSKRLSQLRPGALNTLGARRASLEPRKSSKQKEPPMPVRVIHVNVPVLPCQSSRFEYKDLLVVPKNPRSGVEEPDQEVFTEAVKDKRTEADLKEKTDDLNNVKKPNFVGGSFTACVLVAAGCGLCVFGFMQGSVFMYIVCVVVLLVLSYGASRIVGHTRNKEVQKYIERLTEQCNAVPEDKVGKREPFKYSVEVEKLAFNTFLAALSATSGFLVGTHRQIKISIRVKLNPSELNSPDSPKSPMKKPAPTSPTERRQSTLGDLDQEERDGVLECIDFFQETPQIGISSILVRRNRLTFAKMRTMTDLDWREMGVPVGQRRIAMEKMEEYEAKLRTGAHIPRRLSELKKIDDPTSPQSAKERKSITRSDNPLIRASTRGLDEILENSPQGKRDPSSPQSAGRRQSSGNTPGRRESRAKRASTWDTGGEESPAAKNTSLGSLPPMPAEELPGQVPGRGGGAGGGGDPTSPASGKSSGRRESLRRQRSVS